MAVGFLVLSEPHQRSNDRNTDIDCYTFMHTLQRTSASSHIDPIEQVYLSQSCIPNIISPGITTTSAIWHTSHEQNAVDR